jgi:hypothetical protein
MTHLRLTKMAGCLRAGIVLIALSLASPALGQSIKPEKPKKGASPSISLNQDFVRSLWTKVDTKKPLEVFAAVFNRLPGQVTVYPSENYFYWSFNASGKPIWGNFRLDAATRDKGILNLGYFEYDENGKFQDYKGGEAELTAKQGVLLKKVDRFTYTVSFKGKTVRFNLFRDRYAPPKKGAIRTDEQYVGPVFDESGLRFHLLFNKTEKHLFYVLNEDVPVTESFRPTKINKDVVIGRRSGFAYYLDRENKRKILIGVNQLNVRRNNYYDGPFDQLPDNLIEKTKLAEFLVKAYPELKGRVNKYGHLKARPGERATVFSYFVYTDEAQLAFVQSCAETTKFTRAQFLECITPDGR